MAKGTLKSVWLKLGRAEKHLHELEAIIQKIMEAEFSVATENDVETLRFGMEIPNDLALVAGDFLCNVRAALDHLVSQLVISNRLSATKGKTYFPICGSADRFREYGISQLKGVSSDAITIFEGLQPYHTGNALQTLSRLNNADKHHTLAITTLVTHDLEFFSWNANFSDRFPQKWVWLEHEELRQGSDVERHVLRSDPKVNVDVKGTILVSFEYSWSQDNLLDWQVGPTLHNILDFVKNRVVPSFEPFFD